MKIVPANDAQALRELYTAGWSAPGDVVGRVAEILADVRDRGDDALLDWTRRFDDPNASLARLRVAIPPLDAARALVPPQVASALELARARVERFHRLQLRDDVAYREDDGTRYELRARPLRAIAAYVPGGTAVLPTSVLMNVVPAKVAGVGRTVVLTPPQRDGTVAGAVLFACALCEVDELYAAGGAQAIAAAAYGTQCIARVEKIVGPGNVYVTEAKRQVFGSCAIDGLAGPSEVLVVADDAAEPAMVVGELLAQAEHDPLARVAVVSASRATLEVCARLLDAFNASSLPRGEIVAGVLASRAFLIHARDVEEVLEVVDRFAPEHLSLQVADAQAYLPRIDRVGAVFVGAQTPVACGDYLAGTNHVLPTSGAARFSSGLRTADFLRTFSILENSAERMRGDAPSIVELAEFEGLKAHAQTARMRIS